jgi:hypothetical protein
MSSGAAFLKKCLYLCQILLFIFNPTNCKIIINRADQKKSLQQHQHQEWIEIIDKNIQKNGLFPPKNKEIDNLQENLRETKEEVNRLYILVNDLKVSANEVRQSTNDHTLVHWLKDTMVDMKDQIVDLALEMASMKATKDQENINKRLENEMQQMRLEMRNLSIKESKTDAELQEEIQVLLL